MQKFRNFRGAQLLERSPKAEAADQQPEELLGGLGLAKCPVRVLEEPVQLDIRVRGLSGDTILLPRQTGRAVRVCCEKDRASTQAAMLG